MIIVAGLHLNAQETAINAFRFAFFIMNTGHISAAVSDDTGYIFQLSRFVDKLDQQTCRSARLTQATVNDTGKTGHINISARNDTDNTFPF